MFKLIFSEIAKIRKAFFAYFGEIWNWENLMFSIRLVIDCEWGDGDGVPIEQSLVDDDDSDDDRFEEYVDYGEFFQTVREFNSRNEMIEWAKEQAVKYNIYLVIVQSKGSNDGSRVCVWLQCERRQKPRKKQSTIEDDVEEGERRKHKCSGPKSCRCPFKLKG
ncbi:hypothetical protein M9H77_17777 [Catharanthus roseus]|uniref:Uncharacterized protein n=1 Tax=Catharanthus roseus TaxID=4058 RepID=A0ACC0B5K1_CATRO|nr:hypothetical protein M9H77_17777 [Catharanthus roseus]